MKQQVTRGDEEMGPSDEKVELLSEVRKFLHIFLFSIQVAKFSDFLFAFNLI